MRDEYQLDSRYLESLLYGLKDDKYTLLAAMYVMYGVSIYDPLLLDIGGPLLQWHDHTDRVLEFCLGVLRAALQFVARQGSGLMYP